jgi:hypothetical protein
MELGNKMNGGYPRWQSQNLKRLRIPILDSIPKTVAGEILEAYHRKDYNTINRLVSSESISELEISSGQMSFFESREKYQAGNGKD